MCRKKAELQEWLSTSYYVLLFATLNLVIEQKRTQYKMEWRENIQKLKEKTEKLSVKNKFIATLTHEIRNCVTK
jgi:hypothetical protein